MSRWLTGGALAALALFGLGMVGCQGAGDQPWAERAATYQADEPGLPYVYTNWEQFTTENTDGGLPNDHIFAVKADGDLIWVGTEGGLGCFNKRTRTWRSWKEEDGLPVDPSGTGYETIRSASHQLAAAPQQSIRPSESSAQNGVS